MRLGSYLDKGIWGLADKALPVLYGIAYVVLVIRVLPEEEFGNFVLVQEAFLVISTLATAFALQPLLKYASEDNVDTSGVITVSLVLHAAFLLVCSLVILFGRHAFASLLHSPALAPLLAYVPMMLAASFMRNVVLVLLQTRFQVQRIFWTDAVHFLGAPFLVWILSRMNQFDTALDLVYVNIVSLSASSFLGIIIVRPLFKVTSHPSREQWRAVWDYGAYSLGGILSYLAYSKADTFVLAAATGPIQVALYNSAKIFTRVFEMATQVVQMFILPGASLLSSRGDRLTLKAVVEKALLFSTLGMFPVLLGLFFLAVPLVSIVYAGRYPDAVGILQIFAFASLAVPVLAIGSSVLMGLGEARVNFVLGVQLLVVSLIAYVVLVPWLGAIGAAWGVVIASYIMAWLTMRRLRRYVPVTLSEVSARRRDIGAYIRMVMQKFSRGA
jgi:O-antigen/teichoic acid export membrane protein